MSDQDCEKLGQSIQQAGQIRRGLLEPGRRRPEGPAQALLRVAAKNPRLVAEALGSA